MQFFHHAPAGRPHGRSVPPGAALDPVAHRVAAHQVGEIALVQRGQRLFQLARAGAARQVVIVVDVFLRQRNDHV